MKILLFGIISSLLCSISIAQTCESDLRSLYEDLQSRKLTEVMGCLIHLNSSELSFKTLLWEVEILKTGNNKEGLHSEIVSYQARSKLDVILKNLHLGEYYIQNNNQDSSYAYFNKALLDSEKISDSIFICKSLYGILFMSSRNTLSYNKSAPYLQKYRRYAYNNLEKFYAQFYNSYFTQVKNQDTRPRAFLDSLSYEFSLAVNSESYFALLEYYQKNGVFYEVLLGDQDSAMKYYRKGLNIINNNANYHFLEERRKGILTNIGIIHYTNKDYLQAQLSFNEALKIKSSDKRLKNEIDLNNWLVKNHLKIGYIDSVEHYLNRKDSLMMRLNELELTKNIEELDRKYDLSLEKTKRNKITLVFVILIGSSMLFSYLLYKYFSRKRTLVEQEKELLIKQLELSSIDAMIEGQEKERHRIANELHDTLGGLLATLKLYIQNLKVRKNNLDKQYDTIIKNTDAVLEEAYQKVRSIAQTRNAGVLTSEGLIPAIQNYASKVSASNSIIVEVEDYGMETRLNSSTEITLFRIVQELITNVIKHANAGQITIHITNHEESINLMVEDNGNGFDLEKTNFEKGMGLSSIKKRIENLNGTFKIDTMIGKGTTVIIDIPTI